ncbi:MAG: T9SS type A sorting domain-containing protein, partial [Candidatus Cloacimonadota bacterium]
GLRIIDVSTPSVPYEVGYYDTPDWANGVYVSGSYAYVADDAALRIIDVSTPSAPSEVGYYVTPYWAYGVYVSGSYAYVADRYAGLQIYEFLGVGVEESKDIVSFSKLRILQNLIRDDYIKFELCLTQRDDIEVGLYNLLGQRVKTLSLNSLSAGKHNLKLQTKGLSSGIYFLRFEGELNNQSVKVTILK